MPGNSIPHFSWAEAIAFDKWVHAGIFFVEVFVLVPSLRASPHALWLAVLLAGMLGYGTELGQLFLFEDRTFDYYDLIANLVGAFCGAVFARSRLAGRVYSYLYAQ